MTVRPEYRYEIWRQDVYLGILENVTSDFDIIRAMNSAGSQLTINVNQNPDVSTRAPEAILDETGDPILDETSDPILEESYPEIVGDDHDSILMRKNNDVIVYEISDDNINGRLAYSGYISKLREIHEGQGGVVLTCLNHSQDMQHYTNKGSVADSLDQSQATSDGDGIGFWSTRRYGQVFRTGVGVSNISKIKLRHWTAPQARTYTVRLWHTPSDAVLGGTPLASAQATVPAGGTFVIGEYDYVFAAPFSVSASTDYFYSIDVDSGAVSSDTNTWGNFDSNSAGGYANGSIWRSSPAGSAWTNATEGAYDMWFKTYQSNNNTSITYLNTDISNILTSEIDYYNTQGGAVQKPPGGYTLTGIVPAELTFKQNTFLEIVQKLQGAGPSDWIWYVDPATEILYYKQIATAAEHTIVKGSHASNLELEDSSEDVINVGQFAGGNTGGGSTLFVEKIDSQSLITERRGLARIADNRETDASVALLILENKIEQSNDNTYTGLVTIPRSAYDTGSYKQGQMVGFSGWGARIDALILPIATAHLQQKQATLTLGKLPLRTTALAEQLRKELIAAQTIDNPDTPS